MQNCHQKLIKFSPISQGKPVVLKLSSHERKKSTNFESINLGKIESGLNNILACFSVRGMVGFRVILYPVIKVHSRL